MDLPPPSKWLGYAIAIYVVLAVGGEIASAKLSVILSVLSEALPFVGPALSGDPVSIIVVTIFAMVVVHIFVVIPGRWGLFKMLRP